MHFLRLMWKHSFKMFLWGTNSQDWWLAPFTLLRFWVLNSTKIRCHFLFNSKFAQFVNSYDLRGCDRIFQLLCKSKTVLENVLLLKIRVMFISTLVVQGCKLQKTNFVNYNKKVVSRLKHGDDIFRNFLK